MYLEKCTIHNIKCFEDVSLDFCNPDGSIRQWNVLIGDNGWRVDQILTSHLFGLETTRSPEIAKLLEEYDDLLARRVVNTLTAEEATRLATIENELREDLSAPGETLKQREQYQRMQEYITKTLEQEHT